jgi:hypothetical protein
MKLRLTLDEMDGSSIIGRKLWWFLKLPIPSWFLNLDFIFFKGIAKRLLLWTLLVQPSCKCLLVISWLRQILHWVSDGNSPTNSSEGIIEGKKQAYGVKPAVFIWRYIKVQITLIIFWPPLRHTLSPSWYSESNGNTFSLFTPTYRGVCSSTVRNKEAILKLIDIIIKLGKLWVMWAK